MPEGTGGAVADRRRDILEHAARLLSERGIAGCTVRGIAEEVGIGSGSLYHHFDSKDAIVEEIVVGYLTRLTERYAEVTQERVESPAQLQALVRASLEVAHVHAAASDIYQGERAHFATDQRFATIRALAADVQRVWNEAIEEGVRDGSFRTDVNPRVFHRFIRDAVFLASRWFRPSEAYQLEDLAEDTARIFLDGFILAPRETSVPLHETRAQHG